MFRSCTNYALKRTQIFHHARKSFCKPNFTKDYIKNIQKNLSDFQNTFGFDESLVEKRLETVAREKKLIRTFTVFGVLACTAGKVVED